MSDLLAEGEGLVRGAEASLRELMQTAVQDGQYQHLTVLARWAEQLSRITMNGAATAEQNVAANSVSPAGARTVRAALRKKNGNRRKSKYPFFKRSGENLVKIGWSKSSKSEYQHQAPKTVIVALAEKMANAASDDTLITMDNVLPLATEDQPEVPTYQSYACLAWLRELGVVEQHGRQGYAVKSVGDAIKLIENGWLKLPTPSG